MKYRDRDSNANLESRLRNLPREKASPQFEARVMAGISQKAPSPRSFGRLGFALLLGLSLLALGFALVLRSAKPVEKPSETPALVAANEPGSDPARALRREYELIAAELASLRQALRPVKPGLLLARTPGYDLVLDVESFVAQTPNPAGRLDPTE